MWLRHLQIRLWRHHPATHGAAFRDRLNAGCHAGIRRERARNDGRTCRQGGTMSETVAMPPVGTTETKAAPTVYFIDDSATMREVIKIAFRRENIHVITCGDAASALNQFEQHPPDVVITDVIMPDQDGYSVCSQIKQNPQFGKTPVILMSGVVNKSVADRAVAVQADELVRKPFQPQELISRVKNLIGLSAPALQQPAERPSGVPALSSLFASPAAPRAVPLPVAPPPALHASE